MYLKKITSIVPIVLTICILCLNAASAQVNQVQFGKNRVQYHDDFDQWLYYEMPLFTVNWYGKSRSVGQKVVHIAEQEFKDIIKTIDFKTNEKTEFLIFADVTDLKQSNIGLEDAFIYEDELTKTEGNKIFIAFDGNHNHLRRQIREGIASVYLNNILFGSNLQEIVQNSIMLNLPLWYKNGLISYFGEEWSQEWDTKLHHAMSVKKYKNFEKMARDNPRLAGHMFWNYIGFNYGKNAIGNLVYVTRINRNLDKGFQYVLGTSYSNIINNIWNYYQNLDANRTVHGISLDAKEHFLTKMRRHEVAGEMHFSPDGQTLLVATNQIGKIRVRLIDIATGQSRTLYKYGVKNLIQQPDFNYPVLAWNDDGSQILMIIEKRDYIQSRIHNLRTGEVLTDLIPERFQRIYSAGWWDDNNVIFSAAQNGYSDLYLYRLKTRQTLQITNDAFDDLDVNVATLGGQKNVYFASNRLQPGFEQIDNDTILPVGPFDIYSVFPLNGVENWQMVQHTFTEQYSEMKPSVAQEGNMSFLSNQYKNNAIIHLPKNHNLSPEDKFEFSVGTSTEIIKGFALHPHNNNVVLKYFNGDKIGLVKVSKELLLNEQFNQEMQQPEFGYNYDQPAHKDPQALKNADRTVFNVVEDSIPEHLQFVTKFGDMPAPNTIPEQHRPLESGNPEPTASNTMARLNPLNIVPYRLQFKLTDTQANFDNSLLFEGLSTYAGEGGNNLVTPMGFLLKAHLRDMYENYRLEGGIRIPISLNGNETYIVYDDLTKRTDIRLAAYRKTVNERLDAPNLAQNVRKNVVLLGQVEARYPIDVFNAVKLTATLRQDKLFYKASDNATLVTTPEAIERVGLKASYILDNTIDRGLNLYHGTRALAFVEWVKKFDINLEDKLAFEFNKGHMWVAGFDARHYLPIDKHTIFAGRVASQVSFGSEQILYYLGGADSWLFPTFNQETQSDLTANYAYQMPAPNLRGFAYNIRNGNNFALANGELRIPLFRYLSRKTIESSFLNNFQAVGFFDLGTAWNGWDPFSKYNPLNTVVVTQPGIEVKVNYFRNPVVFGYGAGVRFLLFGYYLRLDYARGWDTGNLNKPRLHISMGTDF